MTNIEIARAYYTALGKKDIQEARKYFHEDVNFIGPLAVTQGIDNVINAGSKLCELFTTLEIRKIFDSENQAVVIYDIYFPQPIGKCRGVSLLTIQDGLITVIELFYDATPFTQEKIFE